jgi:hypothetical protein
MTMAAIDRPPEHPHRATQRNRGKTSPRAQAMPRAAGSAIPSSGPMPGPEPSAAELSASERYRQISLCAYFKAERRGFTPGHMWDDWLEAEREITEKHSPHPPAKPGNSAT